MSFRQDTPKIELLQLMWRSTNPKDQEALINHENDENDNSPDELSITIQFKHEVPPIRWE